MKNATLNWVRLPLQGVENCRELGGIATAEGQQTAWHTFLRSSDLTALTEEDINFLQQYGLKHVIDLRSADEIEDRPNPLATTAFNTYDNIAVINSDVSNLVFADDSFTMGKMYINLLQESKGIIKVLQTIAAQDGLTLFHCAAGKDRTGIIAMLLLGLAGVAKQDIVSNYEVTYTNIPQLVALFQTQTATHPHASKDMMLSKSDYIIEAYEHIIETYGSFECYVKQLGLTDEEILRIKKRFIVNFTQPTPAGAY